MDKGYCVFLLWLIVLYASGAAHFLQGFLLTRREIHLKSSVSDGVSCCMEAKYDKVIILLIDALRYDFLLYDNKTKEEGMSIAHNNMPVVQRLIEDNHGILYQVRKNILSFQQVQAGINFVSLLQILLPLQCNV